MQKPIFEVILHYILLMGDWNLTQGSLFCLFTKWTGDDPLKPSHFFVTLCKDFAQS